MKGPAGAPVLLKVESLHVRYGHNEVIHGVNLEVRQGEIVTILGANGAGKSTTLMTISGLVRPSRGAIRLAERDLHRLRAHDVVKAGVAQVPEGRRIFNTLTVAENLLLGAYTSRDQALRRRTADLVFGLFPVLSERKEQLAGTLSGGEQQMLAIGRALMAQPSVLLLDEPSLGLAPLLVKAIFETIREINRSGVTVLLVEQNARAALKLAHRGYVMELGRVVLEDSSTGLLENPQVRQAYLGGEHR